MDMDRQKTIADFVFQLSQEKELSLFPKSYLTYGQFLEKRGMTDELDKYRTAMTQKRQADTITFYTFVFLPETPMSADLLAGCLDRCDKTRRVYNFDKTRGTVSTRHLCYFWRSQYGMFIIMPECNTCGNVDHIVVRVYADINAYISDVMDLWSLMFIQNPNEHRGLTREKILIRQLMFE